MPDRQPTRDHALLTLSCLLTLGLTACGTKGSGVAGSEIREVDAFEAVDVSGAFEVLVHVDPDAPQKVEVRGDDNIIAKVTTTVDDGELEIGVDGNMIRPELPLTVEIWTPKLNAIEASGANDIDVEGIRGESFEVDVSGASDTTLRGTVDSLEVGLSGAGEIAARELQAKSVEVDISGAGEAEVFASESLDADISGAGEVTYWGSPATVDKSIPGAGELKPGA